MGRRLLIVEDNAALREMFAATFAASGFSVRLAQTSEEALRLAASEMPDAVLTDWDLPDCSGLDLCRDLRDRFTDVPLPMWIMTGNHDGDMNTEALMLGVVAVIRKPFSVPAVATHIKHTISPAPTVNHPGPIPESMSIEAYA